MANKTNDDSGVMNTKESENIHSGHRKRMKEKFDRDPSSLSDHELIELLLFYSIPHINTNTQAHKLYELAGKNLSKLFDLDKRTICSVENTGEGTYRFFRVLRELSVRMAAEALDTDNSRKITRANIGEKLKKLFLGAKEERLIMISVDKKCQYLNDHIISEGTQYAACVPFKKIVDAALTDNAAYVFFAHNHPNGSLIPSKSDIAVTRDLCHTLSLIDIPVIEHYIVADNGILGITRETDFYKDR